MSEIVRCDHCGKEAKERHAVNWFTLERFGTALLTMGQEPGPWHLCGLDCLSHWCDGHPARSEGPVKLASRSVGETGSE